MSIEAAQAFAQKHKPKGRKSKLHPHLESIQYLKDEGYTIEQIQEFLKEQKISISYTALQSFIKRHCSDESKSAPAKTAKQKQGSVTPGQLNRMLESDHDDGDVWEH